METIQWNESSEPRRSTLADVLYNIRREDPDNLLMDSVTPEDIIADSEGVLQFDALVIPYQQLQRRMTIMRRLMNRVGTTLKVEEDTDEVKGMVISEPFKKNGAAHIAVTFNLEDGQTITVFFHNPDATPQKIGPTDDLISWKWLINKKDVTIVVAPEHGKDLDVHEVARRIMKLADKNSAAFARANAKKAERLKKIEEQESELERLEKELAEAKAAFEEMKADADVQAKRRADAEAKFLEAEQRVASLTAERNTLKAKKAEIAAAKKAENEKSEATKNFPPIQDNNDFADFQEEHEDDGSLVDELHNQHMLKYLVSTGQTHFSAKIPEVDGTSGDGRSRRRTSKLYEEWKYEGGKWIVKQGENGYWDDDDHGLDRGYWAFRDFAIGVRNGSLKVLSGNGAKAANKPANKPAKPANGAKVNLASMTEDQLLDIAEKFAEGDDSDPAATSLAAALERNDRLTIGMLINTMKRLGYDTFSYGESGYDKGVAQVAWQLGNGEWKRWAGRVPKAETKQLNGMTMVDVLQELGDGYRYGTLQKGMGGLDDPRLQNTVDQKKATTAQASKGKAVRPPKISSVRQFCELINESNSALEADDKLRARLMAFLEKEWPNFEGRSAEGSVHWDFRDGEWYFTGDDGVEKPRSAVDTDGTKVIFDFYGADANNTLRRAESKPAQASSDSEWAAAEAELNQIIAGTHPKFGDESLQEPLIAYYQKYENDPEKIAVVNAAIDAWQAAALKASEEITSGKVK